MIDKLEEKPIIDQDGNCYGFNFPTTREMFNKINEIIDVVNKLLSVINIKSIEDKGE